MSMATVLVALFPAPVRRRWGGELEHQIGQVGPRAWPNAVAAAVTLWLRPALWPETMPGERRQVMAVFAVAVTAGTALVLRATGALAPSGRVGVLGTVALSLLLLGMIAAAPIPRPKPAALRGLVALAVRILALPFMAGLALFTLGNSHLVDHQSWPLHALLATSYWLTLAFAGFRACRLVGRTAELTTPPTHRRIRVALTLIGGGLSLAAAQVVLHLGRTPGGTNDLVAIAALLGLALAVVTTGRDLHTTV